MSNQEFLQKMKEMTVTIEEFIRKFLLHIYVTKNKV